MAKKYVKKNEALKPYLPADAGADRTGRASRRTYHSAIGCRQQAVDGLSDGPFRVVRRQRLHCKFTEIVQQNQ